MGCPYDLNLQKKLVFNEHDIPQGGIIVQYQLGVCLLVSAKCFAEAGNSVGAGQKGQEMKKNPSHEDNLVALRRIEGQVRGVQRMIEDRKYCIDILNQIYAIKGALGRVEEKVLEKHFQHCVTEAVKGSSKKEKQQKLDEILKLIHQTRRA